MLFAENMFSGGWNDVYLKLYSDSNLLAYKKKGDRDAKVQICMKVCESWIDNSAIQVYVSNKEMKYSWIIKKFKTY